MELSSTSHVGPFDEPRPSASGAASSFLDTGDVAQLLAPAQRDGRPPLRRKKPIEIAWADFLKPYSWQWFATFTFKEAVHPEAGAKRFQHWMNLLDESHGYRCRMPSTHWRACTWVRGLEYQKRDVIHFHALIGNWPGIDSLDNRFRWSERWLSIGGTGISRIYPVEEAGGVAGYIAKYCSKGGEIDVSSNMLAHVRVPTRSE